MQTTATHDEVWKPVIIDVKCVNKSRYEVSNHGRVRSFNKVSNGRILKGSITEGYRIWRLKLHSPRSEASQQIIDEIEKDLAYFYGKKRKILEKEAVPALTLSRVDKSIERREKKLRAFKKKDFKKRTIHRHFLIHQLVAQYFLPQPQAEETILAHLDYEKLNNHVSNLKWMRPEEHQEHIRKSPYVIAEKKQRKYTQRLRTRNEGWKLTSTDVIHIKKLLKRGWTLRKIAKQFNVSDMQIHRIKTNENWSHIKIPD